MDPKLPAIQDAFFKIAHCEIAFAILDDTIRFAHFIEIVYNRKRLHSALGYVPQAKVTGCARAGNPPRVRNNLRGSISQRR